MKVIPNIKVSDMEFLDPGSICTRKVAERNGAIMSNGEINYYRIQFMKGQGGSPTEETWDRKNHWHTCCKSRVCWRHKIGCPRLNF
jgi:hypothetical protein